MSEDHAHLDQQDVYAGNDRRELLPYVPRGVQSVLDVGCARGEFGARLRSLIGHSLTLHGLDPVESAVVAARATGAFDGVYCGYFPQSVPEAADYDLVCFNDVLEHVLDPWLMLRQAKRYLKSDGRVLVSIPSIRYAPIVIDLLRGRWTYTSTGTLDRTHVRFFTRSSMLEMFHDAGYAVETCVGINPVGVHREQQMGAVARLVLRAARRVLGDFSFLQFVIVARPLDG